MSAARLPLQAALAAAALACSAERPGVPPRHAILITVAGMRADHTSAYLYPRPTTAWEVDGGQKALGRAVALDDIAAEGVLFANAFAPCADPVGSLAALHTGRAPRVGERATGLLPEERTLAEDLREAGFRSAAFVSGSDLAVAGGFDQGFEHFVHHPTDVQTLVQALSWLTELDLGSGKPLFLWLHLAGPQPPFEPYPAPPRPGPEANALDYARLFLQPGAGAEVAARDYGALFADPSYRGAASGSAEYLARHSVAGSRGQALADLRHVADLYDGDVAQTASLLRSFLLALQEVTETAALWEDSALCFCGITGAELWEHGTYGQTVLASSTRVPLFLHHRGSLTGARVLAPAVDLADVAPTLREWMGVDLLARTWNRRRGPRDGRSLLALTDAYVKKPFDARPCVTVGPSGAAEAVLRTPRWSLLWRPREEGAIDHALFDRERDPLELRDVSAENPEVLAELRTELTRLFAPDGG